MPHNRMPGYERGELLIWILAFAFESILPRMRDREFHRAAHRYIAELKIRGITEPKFYQDVVSRTYDQVDDAIHALVAHGMAEWDDLGRATLLITARMKYRELTEQNDLTPSEVRLAQQAAQVTRSAYDARTLNDLPVTESPSPAE